MNKKTKKLIIFLSVIAVVVTLGACGKKANSATSNVKVTEENNNYLVEYEERFKLKMYELTDILIAFNDAVDGIYTEKTSKSQFAKILTNLIEKSNGLIKDIESWDIDPEIFELHQYFIALANRSHQLFLDAIEMANDPDYELDKGKLREEYLAIKDEQAELVNQWKILKEQLSTSEQTK